MTLLPLILVIASWQDAPQLPPHIEDLKIGKGVAAMTGDLVVYTYIGKRDDGSVFDASDKTKITLAEVPPIDAAKEATPEAKLPNNVPTGVIIGSGELVPGLEAGFKGMKVGGIRKITLGARQGYNVPPEGHLHWEVTVWDIIKKGTDDEVNIKDLVIGKGKAVRKGKTVDLTYRLICMNGLVVAEGPVTIKAGNGDLIEAVDKRIVGLRVGSKRQFHTSPKPLQAAVGAGSQIPPKQSMLFEVTVLKVQ